MRRITADDERLIIQVIDQCSARSCSWETIRETLAKSLGGPEKVWTRQAMKAHPQIYSKYLGKVQSRRGAALANPDEQGGAEEVNSGPQPSEDTELQKLQRKYDALVLRYRRLIFNASLLPGGLKLLIGPLPRGQQEGSRARAAGKTGKR